MRHTDALHPRPASEPLRTCVGCRIRQPATGMTRLTSHDGRIRSGGPSAGRGAWVCSEECFDVAKANGSLNRALRLN
ncbi:MAG: YlxR family protein [Acidimicrobiales bacterium]